MDIKQYEKKEHFDRNRAIYVLITIDNATTEEVASNFHLNVEEINDIVALHKQYEDQMK